MSDKNLNNNIGNVVKKGKIVGLFIAGRLFLNGLGLCFLLAYPGMVYLMQESEWKFKNELNSLKSVIKENPFGSKDVSKAATDVKH
jgi:hypothetical protein